MKTPWAATAVAVVLTLSAAAAFAQPAPRFAPPAPTTLDFNVTAGNAFFDQTPVLGEVCTFDFGDPAGAYNVLKGYNAAHIYQTPGDYTLKVSREGQPALQKTIHVQADHRRVQVLEPRDSLMDVIRSLQNNTVVLLAAGGSWDLPGPVEIKARNVQFRAAGPGPKPRIRRLASKGYSTLLCNGLDITFNGIEFDTDRDMKALGNEKVSLRAIVADGAHIAAINCTFRNFDDAIFCTAITRGVLIQWCTFTDELRAYGLWCDGCNLVVLGNKMATSQREHNIRCSQKPFYNLLVYDNDLTATHGKETLTFRVGEDMYAARNAFHGWVRVGSGPRGDHRPMTPEELKVSHVWHAVVERNAFFDNAHLQINEGTTDLKVLYNRLTVDNKGVPIVIQGPSVNQLVIEGNYRVLTAGPTQKPHVRAFDMKSDEYVERDSSTKNSEEAEALKGK